MSVVRAQQPSFRSLWTFTWRSITIKKCIATLTSIVNTLFKSLYCYNWMFPKLVNNILFLSLAGISHWALEAVYCVCVVCRRVHFHLTMQLFNFSWLIFIDEIMRIRIVEYNSRSQALTSKDISKIMVAVRCFLLCAIFRKCDGEWENDARDRMKIQSYITYYWCVQFIHRTRFFFCNINIS